MESKVLLVDMGYLDYFQEFSNACMEQVDTTIVTKYHIDVNSENIKRFFYKYSDRMKEGKLRKVLRLLEYIYGYYKVYKLAKRNEYDIIHIHWFIVPVVDNFVASKLKKYCKRLVYTAHDVIPHILKENSIETFRKLYDIPDKIIVHGNECYDEFKKYYSEYIDKVYIQEFGVNKKNNDPIQMCSNLEGLKQKMDVSQRVFSFIGQIFYNKGVDRLLDYWIENKKNSQDLLVIVGNIREHYEGLDDKIKILKEYKNTFLCLRKFSIDEEHYLYYTSDLVILPYRHASMSGVFFSAAQHDKTVLITDVGCLREYVPNEEHVFICENTDEQFHNQMKIIDDGYTKRELNELGICFSNDIYEKYQWKKILKKLIEKCYFSE